MKKNHSMIRILLPGLLWAALTWSMMMPQGQLNLPIQIGGWVRPDSCDRVDALNIFDYMDGAGELYLGYRFDSLQVYRYVSHDEEILVEIYHMGSPEDAFGLLSLDWGGEPVELGGNDPPMVFDATFPHGLYGAGLLRLWADNFYVRIMAYRETPESRETILALGRIIAEGKIKCPPPAMLGLARVPDDFSWRPQWRQTSYLRSYLVLNSLYYLANGNILDLDHTTAAVLIHYAPHDRSASKDRVVSLIIAYADEQKAESAWKIFASQFLPDQTTSGPGKKFFYLEEGWMGYQLIDRFLLLILSCPDERAGNDVLKNIERNIKTGGG